MGLAVWLQLDRLMALPLDAVARATLARELLALMPPDGVASGHDQLRESLELQLFEDELDRCRRLGQAGEWLEALQRMEALLPDLERWATADASAVLLELVVMIHRATVIEPGSIPSEDRLELLWLTRRWLKRLDGLGVSAPDWFPTMREQLCCEGAIGWLDRVRSLSDPHARAEALRRSHTLLDDLAAWMVPCPDWIAPNLLEGLRSACELDSQPFHPLAERVDWARTLARLAPESSERERLEGLLQPALAAIEVGRALRLPAFPPPSVGR